ncbi:hypothetical protein [Dyella caseinilytica]|uniref:Uncharacterized protein n=1 Tax=Dyella caseinilytica TaxID=1849581 RepID=A0ABX7GUU5_9GAMM|nr:hypothetical protein [Dyella caseinilytica]QRN54197.1 hypothetical protein ISN74_01995 [Dyella caseinilytica]GFZ92271.1 hypothetical protein GCM10011408_09730 [Dyella caseinilytica]
MCVTIPEMALSAGYRKAQRLLSGWLEHDRTARRQVFMMRATIAALSAPDRHSLSRWLAWLHVAAISRGESILARIQRLDPALGASTELALARLPVNIVGEMLSKHRKSA